MGSKDICILVVHDDSMQRNIILDMLENWDHYEVIKFKRTDNALKIIQKKREWLSVVVTDVQLSHPNGTVLLNYIIKEFKLPVISIAPHQNARVGPVELDRNAKLYFMKSLDVKEFNILWQNANTKERSKQASFQGLSVVKEKETGASSGSKLLISEMIQEDPKGKKFLFEEIDEDDSFRKKNPRVMWNAQIHQKFLKAIQQLGLDNAYPKQLLEIMNIPGLTRYNVASHLQKYRESLKNTREKRQFTSSISEIYSTSRNHFDSLYPKKNQVPFHVQNNFSTSLQQGSSSVPISNYMHPGASTSVSNLGQQQFPSANNYFFDSKTPSTYPINMNTNIPLSNFYSNHFETPTGPTNLELQSFFNQESFISPCTYNSPLITATQTRSTLLANDNTQPIISNNASYVGLGITGNGELIENGQTSSQYTNAYTVNPNLLNDGNGHESLAPFPSTEMDFNYEQQFNVLRAEGEIEDHFDALGGVTGPDIMVYFDDSTFDHI